MTKNHTQPPLAVITGASSGIGQALAKAYLERGWRVALMARRVQEMTDFCVSGGWPDSQWRVYGVDMRDELAVMRTGQDCLRQQGVPQVVIANAGISSGVDTATAESFDILKALYETNVIGLAATFQPFILPMKQQGSGTLVGMASVAGLRGLPGHAGYSGTKAAALTHCESLRVELRGSGVKVVTLMPGFVTTPMTAGDPYKKPFEISAEDFAQRALRVIDRQSARAVIPWQMGWVGWLMRLTPPWLYDRVTANRPRKGHRQVL